MLPAEDLLALWRLYCPPAGCIQVNEVSDLIILSTKQNKTNQKTQSAHSQVDVTRLYLDVQNFISCGLYCCLVVFTFLPPWVLCVYWINLCVVTIHYSLSCVCSYSDICREVRIIPRVWDASLPVCPLGGGRLLVSKFGLLVYWERRHIVLF